MKLPNKFSLVLAACIATAGLPMPAVASGLTEDPFIRQNTDRRNFEPGGKFHLFGSRGVTADRTGSITITPVYRQKLGYLEAEYAAVRGDIGYNVRFSDHHHDEHAPFTNSSSRSAADSKGNIGINLTSYNLKWSGTETHPADAYDGEQGSGYPAPTGARDEYRYKISGTVAAMNIRFDDTRSPWQRLADRFTPIVHLPADTKKAWDNATTTNPNLNRAGNAANAVNATAAGIGNVAGAAASTIGAGDAAQGLGVLGAVGGMEAVRALPPAAQIQAVKGIAEAGNAVDRAGNAVRNWARNNPNTSEVAKAAANVGGTALGAVKAINATKTTTTLSNSKVNIQWGKGINRQGMPWENHVGKNLPGNSKLPNNFKTFDYYDRSSGKAISAKTLDTQTPSRLSNPKQVYNTMKRHIDAAANFTGHRRSEVPLNSTMIKQREIHLAIPAKTNSAQRQEMQKAIKYGEDRSIKVIITEIK